MWIKQASIYKCKKELEHISTQLEIDYKQAFKRIFINKRELALFKLGEKLSKKINNYTGLPDLKLFQSDISNLEWYLEFFDKHSHSLLRLKKNEQNNFDAGFSILWTNFSELNLKMVQEAEKIVVFVNVPIYLDYKNGTVSPVKSKSSYYNINTVKIEVAEIVNFFKENQPNNKNLIIEKLHEDSLVKLFNMNLNFLIGYWNNSNVANNDPAFLAFNSIFDLKLIDRIFKNKTDRYIFLARFTLKKLSLNG